MQDPPARFLRAKVIHPVAMQVKIRVRSGTSEEWAAKDPVLLLAEPGYDSTTRTLKIGDGSSRWTELPVTTTPSSGGGGGAPSSVAWADVTGKPVTFPSDPQTLSLSGSDLTLSGGGGTVTLPGDEVSSVNGQTGEVTLDAADVGALPDTTPIPTEPADIGAATAAQGALADSAVQPDDVDDVIREGDTRLTDARTPTSHAHAYADITDPPTIPGPQTLSLTGTDLTLSDGGGTVTLPSGGGGTVVLGGAVPYVTSRLGGVISAVPLVPAGARAMTTARPVSAVPNRMNLMPFTLGMDLPVTGLAVKIATAAAAGQARFALYDTAADGGPGSLLWDSGPIDASVTGVVTLAASLTLPAGPLWSCGAVSSTGVYYYGWDYGTLGGSDSWPPAMPNPRGYAMRTDTPSNIITGGYPATLDTALLDRGHDSNDGAPVIYAKVTT